jgi:predicted metal-dependent HD superfamily phosphohydrolase
MIIYDPRVDLLYYKTLNIISEYAPFYKINTIQEMTENHTFLINNLSRYVNKRFYHDYSHILKSLDLLEIYVENSAFQSCKFFKQDLILIKLAILFHDIIMNTDVHEFDSKISAEDLSANIARKILKENFSFVIEKDVNIICGLIKATKHKNLFNFNVNPLKSIICDIDLYNLAERYDCFLNNRALIKKEYQPISEEQWNRGSIDFVNSFLKRKKIFSSPYFESLEDKARRNLTRYLKGLELNKGYYDN